MDEKKKFTVIPEDADPGDAHFARIGRRIEAERKAKEEADAKAALEAEEKERTKSAVREALKDDERDKRAKARAMLSQATTAAVIAGGIAFYASLIIQDSKSDE